MTREKRMEELSRAYVHAVAARANCACEHTSVDIDSVDMTIKAAGLAEPACLRSPAVEIQLKATATSGHPAESLALRIPRKNYDDLRVETAIPRLLVVLHLPEQENEWVELTHEHMISRRCAYWASLLGVAEIETDQDRVTVHIPTGQRFTPDSLTDIMRRASRKERL